MKIRPIPIRNQLRVESYDDCRMSIKRLSRLTGGPVVPFPQHCDMLASCSHRRSPPEAPPIAGLHRVSRLSYTAALCVISCCLTPATSCLHSVDPGDGKPLSRLPSHTGLRGRTRASEVWRKMLAFLSLHGNAEPCEEHGRPARSADKSCACPQCD